MSRAARLRQGRLSRRVLGPAVLVLVVAAGVHGAGAAAAGESDVVVRDELGLETVRMPLPASGRFELSYEHSYYRRPARESFVGSGTQFALVSVTSPSEAVLDYYAIPGTRSRDGGDHVLLAGQANSMQQLPLIATDSGQRTLIVADRHVPLFEPGGPPRHVVLQLERRPRGWLPFR